jgi:transposase
MDGYLGGSTVGYAGRMEVIEGRTGRRLRSEAERARIAAESLAPGARVVDVARRHGVTRWQVYDWRSKLTAGTLAVPAEAWGEPAFAALVVETPAEVSTRKTRTAQTSPDRIELVVADVTVRVAADVEEAQLTRVIRAVRAASA